MKNKRNEKKDQSVKDLDHHHLNPVPPASKVPIQTLIAEQPIRGALLYRQSIIEENLLGIRMIDTLLQRNIVTRKNKIKKKWKKRLPQNH